MLDVLFIALLQAAAGAPDDAPQAPPVETTAPTTSEPAPPQATAPAPEIDPQDRPRCRTERLLGSRVRSARICTTPREDAERYRVNTDLMNSLQNSHAPGVGGQSLDPGG